MLKNMYAFIQKHKLHHYFYIFVFVIILTYILSHSYFGVCIGFPTTDKDSAKYLISTIIQSEAAILAIVITLSLVAVQQTASSYSTRVIEVFKNMNTNPDFYLLMGIYLSSIIYEMWVLKQITERSGSIENFTHSLFNSFEAHIWICYALGVFSLLALVPYIQNTLDLLKPSTIISLLSEKITKHNIISNAPRYPSSYFNLYNPHINNYEPNEYGKDPILPIVDIINNSLVKYDYAVSIDGLLKIFNVSKKILISINIKDEEFKIVYGLFANYLLSIGKLSIYKDNGTCADLVMRWFNEIMLVLIKKQKDYIASDILDSICEIGQIAIKQNDRKTIVACYRYIQDVFEFSTGRNMEFLRRHVAMSLIEISELSAEYKIEGIYSEIINPLFLIIKRTFKGEYVEELHVEDDEETDVESEDEYKEYYEIIDGPDELEFFPLDSVMLILKGMCSTGQLLYEKKMYRDMNYVTRFIEYIRKMAQEYGREDVLKIADNFLNTYKYELRV